jgi:hypothetical protein
MGEFIAQCAIAIVVAVLVAFLDVPLFGTDLAWYWCALIGIAIGFGGVFVWVVIDG